MDLNGAAAPASICPRRTMLVAAVAAMVLALLGPAPRPAFGHTHPTQLELTEPAVVRVETSVQANISLIEHDRHGKHIGLYQKRYELVVNAGSGFAVDPSGVIVAVCCALPGIAVSFADRRPVSWQLSPPPGGPPRCRRR